MPEANLLVTFDPAHAGGARAEVEALLKEVGEEFKEEKSSVEGDLLLKVSDPKAVVAKLLEMGKQDPEKFKYTNHWLPIEKWTSTKMEDMQAACKECEGKIGEEESWKMDINKRNFDMDTPTLIKQLTDPIERMKVNLKNPQKIVIVQIIGDSAGFSVVAPNEMLIVPKLKS